MIEFPGMQLVLVGGLDPANQLPLDDVWIIDAAGIHPPFMEELKNWSFHRHSSD
jgi:hypothetical protein